MPIGIMAVVVAIGGYAAYRMITNRNPKAGDMVVFMHPNDPDTEIEARIEAISSDKKRAYVQVGSEVISVPMGDIRKSA